MKVLVSGSNGFLGSIFLNFLKERKISYVIYDRNNQKEQPLDFDSVVNFGGLTPNSETKNGIRSLCGDYYTANVKGTELLLKTITKNKNLKRFINIGSSAEYGFSMTLIGEDYKEKPEGPYGKSKLEQSKLVEKFFEKREIKVVNLRLFNVVGLPKRSREKRKSIINPFIFESLFNQFVLNFNGKIIISNENEVRDYVDIDDIMEAVLLALETKNGKDYEIINICSSKGTKLKEVVDMFGGVLNKKYEIFPSYVKGASQSVGINSKAKKILNWSPKISLEESIKKMIW